MSLLAIVLIALITTSSNPKKSERREQKQEARNNSAQTHTPVGAVITQNDSTEDLNKPCAPGQENRSSDLCAQWKAADAADKSAYWSEGTFWTSIIGLALGLFTLCAAVAAAIYARAAAIHTQTGADHAKTSADAAIDAVVQAKSANDIAKASSDAAIGGANEALKNGRRPYVYFTAQSDGYDKTRLSSRDFVIGLKNFGAGPAIGAHLGIERKFFVRDDTLPDSYPRINNGWCNPVFDVIPPGLHIDYEFHKIFTEDEAARISSRENMLCHFILVYESLDGEDIRTDMLVLFEGDNSNGITSRRLSEEEIEQDYARKKQFSSDFKSSE